jgi:hypothetical protein
MNKKGQSIIALRKKGKTYGEIEKILKIPKSTIAWWLKDIKISKSLKKQIFERSKKKWRKSIIYYNTKIRPQKAAKIREEYKEKSSKEIKRLSRQDLKLIGSVLYWAEGNTKNRNRLQFGNSDPLMISIMMRFFRETCNIPDKKIKARIHLYPDTNQKKATNYWIKITRLPKKNFHPPQTQISRASKRKRARHTLPSGTLHLTISNTEITCRVKGWIQGITKKI